MRRVLPLLLLGLATAAPALGQAPRVSLMVSLGPDSFPLHARQARVQARDLLTDKRWAEALDHAFPIRLTFQLQIWRSREGWIDELQRSTQWATVIQREPLQDQYRVTRLLLSGPQEFPPFATREDLARWLSLPTEVEARPTGTGTFYYAVTLTITALSEEDMAELERFLAGEPAESGKTENNSIAKRVRRFLLSLVGLPKEELEVKTEKFRVAP